MIMTARTDDRAAERRMLTILVVDMVASTSLARRLDQEDFAELLNAFHDICGRTIDRFEGRVAKDLGDGLAAHFGRRSRLPQASGSGFMSGVRRGPLSSATSSERAIHMFRRHSANCRAWPRAFRRRAHPTASWFPTRPTSSSVINLFAWMPAAGG